MLYVQGYPCSVISTLYIYTLSFFRQFVNLYVTSECLFALVNGDDMYTTFHSIVQDDSDPLIWYFNKVYLYVFISLFIYVVLSLFIGIVADTYERIKARLIFLTRNCRKIG